MKTKVKVVICILLIATVNLVVYKTYDPILCHKILVRCTVFVVFYSLQILLLFYIIKLQSKFTYLFPLHWGVEIWRLLFRSIIIDNFIYKSNDIMEVIFRYITGPFWIASDYVLFLPNHIVFFIHDFPINILRDYILKLIISTIMLGISVKYALKQYRKA